MAKELADRASKLLEGHGKCSREYLCVEKGVGISLDLTYCRNPPLEQLVSLNPDDVGLRNLALEIGLIFLPEAAIQKITPPEIDNQMILFRFVLCGLANYFCLDCL